MTSDVVELVLTFVAALAGLSVFKHKVARDLTDTLRGVEKRHKLERKPEPAKVDPYLEAARREVDEIAPSYTLWYNSK